LPVVGLATTELPRIVRDSGGGYADTELARLVDFSRELIRDRGHAQELGRKARNYARERFAIERFARDWDAVFREATS
ncbi:MAG TPA: glycosyltransferase family 1 protein, partial [Casimicrobiaceae bacterium]